MGLDPLTLSTLRTQLNTTIDVVCNHAATDYLVRDALFPPDAVQSVEFTSAPRYPRESSRLCQTTSSYQQSSAGLVFRKWEWSDQVHCTTSCLLPPCFRA